ncbi:hypothetical protein KFK09_016938 [Dendrobium nobile]|uniref:Uncharacterized protein n=1 Tax=Dendrobium nobile TaxID=94219 RepID=A0A8T3AZQ1_DENNO|nr:hypothetical protein KFK09_016938 [Dendrobium nobile]
MIVDGLYQGGYDPGQILLNGVVEVESDVKERGPEDVYSSLIVVFKPEVSFGNVHASLEE